MKLQRIQRKVFRLPLTFQMWRVQSFLSNSPQPPAGSRTHQPTPRGWDFPTLLMGFFKIHHSYLSKTPFPNGPQNLKVVKVDCKRKRGEGRNKSDLPQQCTGSRKFSPAYLTTYSKRLPVSTACVCCGYAPPQSGCPWHFPPHPPGSKHLPSGSMPKG